MGLESSDVSFQTTKLTSSARDYRDLHRQLPVRQYCKRQAHDARRRGRQEDPFRYGQGYGTFFAPQEVLH